MDEKRIENEVYAWLSAPIHWSTIYTAPKATVWLIKNTKAIAKKWVKKAWEEMVKELAKKKAIKALGKLWAKMWAKHLAWLAPAATWVWAVAVPLLQAWLLASDIYDLYNLPKDEEFKEWIKYLAEDTVNWVGNTVKWVGNFIKNNPKEAAAALIAPLPYAAYKFAKNSKRSKVQPIAQLADGRVKYSDWSIR